MTKTIEKKEIWTDYQGNDVPVKYVSSYDKKKEKVINKIATEASKINEMLEDFKKRMFAECDKLFDEMFKANDLEKIAQKNYTLYSFDKSFKIEVTSQDVVDFDDRIQLAQAKINEYLKIKTDGADQELSILVNNAFKTKKGRLDKARIFGLFPLKINHLLWLEAMELIKNSIVTNYTRRYAVLYVRDDEGKYIQVQLNFSAI